MFFRDRLELNAWDAYDSYQPDRLVILPPLSQDGKGRTLSGRV